MRSTSSFLDWRLRESVCPETFELSSLAVAPVGVPGPCCALGIMDGDDPTLRASLGPPPLLPGVRNVAAISYKLPSLIVLVNAESTDLQWMKFLV